VVDSSEAMPSRGSSSQSSSNLTPRISQIHLDYNRVQEELRATREELATERETNRLTRDEFSSFNAQMQAFVGKTEEYFPSIPII
jgi:hypothetical protein